jgi:hypothetical protein
MPLRPCTLLGLIVEGHGEERAAPTLIRHIARDLQVYESVKCSVRRFSKSQLLRPREIELAIEGLARQIGRHNPVLVLLDADDDCPTTLAQSLLARCQIAHADMNISVVVANKEYEAWFLAAVESLAGHRGLIQHIRAPEDPESVSGAKEWLTARMLTGETYSPTRHQSAYSDLIDLSRARKARSFRKIRERVVRAPRVEIALSRCIHFSRRLK